MTATELAERMDNYPDELVVWAAEDVLREEDARDAAMVARAKAAIRG